MSLNNQKIRNIVNNNNHNQNNNHNIGILPHQGDYHNAYVKTETDYDFYDKKFTTKPLVSQNGKEGVFVTAECNDQVEAIGGGYVEEQEEICEVGPQILDFQRFINVSMTEPVDQEVFTDECGNVVGKVQRMQKIVTAGPWVETNAEPFNNTTIDNGLTGRGVYNHSYVAPGFTNQNNGKKSKNVSNHQNVLKNLNLHKLRHY